MNVLLSIKPEFADKIFSGDKKFEFRKKIFKRTDIDKIIVYASAPISKVIGEFEIKDILFDDLNKLWDLTKNSAGISKDFFYSYFCDKDQGYAIEIKSFTKYENPYCIRAKHGLTPPQSFVYLDN